ncbi:MAG: imelysin family protein [Bacteroidota bacterium]
MKLQHLFFLFLIIGLSPACENESNTPEPCSSKFDQASLFTNVADNLILPAYKELQQNTNALSDATTAFVQAPSDDNLAALQQVWRDAYLVWQSAEPYNFGPAEAELLRSSLNNYPVNVDAIADNLEAGTWNLDAVDTYDKGFPALDYLLFGTADAVNFFQNNPTALQYLTDVVEQIKSKTDNTLKAWQGDYRATFIANTGTADGTALSQIVNSLNENYENIKRNKIGVPSGVVALGIPFPESVEARFSRISLELTKKALEVSKNYFQGGEGVGLDDYLNEINAEKGDELLTDVINSQYDLAAAELEKIEGPLQVAVEEQNEQVVEAYKTVSTQVVHLKADMTSVLCVEITYIDNPSDSD